MKEIIDLLKAKPILFSPDMIKANLEDRKSETRRTRGLDKINENPDDWEFCRFYNGYAKFTEKSNALNEIYIKSPYGAANDYLWVREKWRFEEEFEYDAEFYPANYWYYASTPQSIKCVDGELEDKDDYKWHPSIHMPKKACRMILQNISVLPERLQDITEEGSINEGVEKVNIRWKDYLNKGMTYSHPVDSYHSLWIKINSIDSWNKNPWIWVIKYKKLSEAEITEKLQLLKK